MGGVELELLGTPRVTIDGAPLEVDTRKAIALLAYLAVTGEERRRDSLAGLLWPEYEQTHARAALRRTLSALNKALGGRALVVNRGALGIDPGELALDVHRFRGLLGGCRAHAGKPSEGCAACLDALARGVALYRDDFMAGFTLRDCPGFDEWMFFEAESLRRDMLQALHHLVRGAAAAGDLDAAVRHAMRWLRLDPLHEPAHQELMRLYALSGRRSAALGHYRDCVALLDRELGVPPLEETTRLYQEIRDERIGPSPSRQLQPPVESVGRPPAPPKTAPPGLPLVGRDEEARVLRVAFEGVGAAGCLVGIEGEAGIGKTRLVEDFLAEAASKGAPVLSVRCHADEGGLAFGVVAEALRELLGSEPVDRLEAVPPMWLAEAARILPELESTVDELPAPPALEVPGARARFLEGLAHVLVAPLVGPPNGVLFVDDLQWIDESSLEVLGYVVARLRRWPVCVVAAWRSEDPSSVGRVRRLLGTAERSGATAHIKLGRLGEEAITELVAASGGSSEEVAGRLFEETEGLPVLISEYLKARAERSDEGWELPGGAREVLLARVSGVSETAGQLLSAASVLGRSFTFETLRTVSGRSEEESLTAVEELVARGLLVETGGVSRGEESYDFSHDKLRAVVYEEATLVRRRLLHRRAAEGLQRQRGAAGASAAVVARHLLEAGDEGAAAQQFKLAGDHARSLFANAEALGHYETALGLGHPDVGALHVAVGDLHTLRGDYRAALAAYERAAARPTGTDMATIEHRIAMVHHRRGDWGAADGYLTSALASVPTSRGDALRARLTSDRSLTAHRAGRHEQAQGLAEEALRLAGEAGDRRALAQAHNILGVLANGCGDFDVAAEHLEISLELADALGEPGGRVAALNNLSLTRRARGELEAALSLAEQALESCVAQGDRHREAALHNNVADLLHSVGDREGSMTHLKAAVAIFAEIGEAQHPQPEIWKLFEW